MSLYKQAGSGVWWINLSHQGQRVRRSSGTTDRTEAQRRHDEVKVELWKTEPAIKGLTWGKAVIHWCGLQERSESELLNLAKFARHFPDRLLTQVTREAVDKALAFCKTPGTYTRYRTMIAAILNAAKAEGWLREVPKLATRVDKRPKPRTWLTHEQWKKLQAELPAHMQPMATFAIETGLRQANVLGLTWSRVDLDRKLVWVEGQDTKSGNAIAVPLSIGAVNVLKTVQGQHAEFVFTFRGKPIKEIKTAFLAACVRAGVGSYATGRYVGFTWHGFRHTWATWHVQNGTPLDVLQKLGGWADLRVITKHYAHHSPGYLAGYADNAMKGK